MKPALSVQLTAAQPLDGFWSAPWEALATGSSLSLIVHRPRQSGRAKPSEPNAIRSAREAEGSLASRTARRRIGPHESKQRTGRAQPEETWAAVQMFGDAFRRRPCLETRRLTTHQDGT